MTPPSSGRPADAGDASLRRQDQRELLQQRSSQRRPLTGEVIRGRAAPAYEYEPEPEQAMLRNPYVLAGTAVAGAIVLAVLVVIFFGGGSSGAGGGDGSSQGGSLVNPLTPQRGSGVRSRSIATATVREGPSAEYLEIGTLRSGQDIDVIGRNAEATWFQILFPPRSSLKGWVPASALRIPEGSVDGIPVVLATPIARPTIAIPTSTPEPPPLPTNTSVPTTPTPTAAAVTPTPSAAPDLSASAVGGSCNLGARLTINVRNNGPPTITNRPIAILVQTADGVQRAFVNTSPLTLAPGQSVDIDTTYVVAERVVAAVDPLGTLGDPNVGNNRVDCVVGPAPTPTRPAGTSTPASIATPPPIATPTRTPVATP
jgi:hypothetical protein